MKEMDLLSVVSFRNNNLKRQRDLMNATKSIAPKLLTLKIKTPPLTHGKGVFLIQQKIAEYQWGRLTGNLGAEVP